jgi:methionine-rich copper-binding protein CopC
MNRILLLPFLVLLTTNLYGQLSDDFSDGDFTSDPVWNSSDESGNGVDFTVEGGELRSAGPSSTSALGIAVSAIPDLSSNDLVWRFSARYGSGAPDPSGSNNIRVYLVANNQDLSAVSSGYYIQMGEGGSADGLDLFAVGVSTPLIEDVGNQVASGINVTIEVSRDASGEWSLQADLTGGTSFSSIGDFSENTFPQSGSFFGFQVNHTSSNNDNFYFDDISITTTPVADTQAPTISNLEVLSGNQVTVTFSEEVEEASAETVSNFSLVPAVTINSAEKQTSNNQQVILTLANELTNGASYTLSIDGVKDLSDNPLTDGEIDFDYVVFSDPAEGDVVINEFLVAPNDDEFVELFNHSDKFFNLENWHIEDEVGNTLTLPEYRLNPGDYVVITSAEGEDSLDVSGFPLFNNSSDEVILKAPDGTVLQSIAYSGFEEGNSFELINPDQLCKGLGNYAINTGGNSAGKVNDNDSDEADEQGPIVSSLTVQSADSLIISFNEPLGEVSSLKDSVLVNDQPATETSLSEDRLTLYVKLSEALISEQEGSLTLLNLPDCLGNLQGTDTSLYIDEKAPVLQSLTAISGTELILVFQEEVEAVTSSDLSKFDLIGQVIDQVDETDTAQTALLVELEESLVINNSYELVIDGLEDTLGNAIDADTSLFTFDTDIQRFEILATNVLEITTGRTIDTAKLTSRNFWNEDLGFASSLNKLDSNTVQAVFDEVFEEDKLFRVYMFNVMGVGDMFLQTPAIEVFIDREAPEVLSWEIPHPDSVFLYFSEPLNTVSATNFSHYRIEDRTPRELFLKSDTSVFLQPPFSLASEVTYELEILGIEDTIGNEITSVQQYEISFDTLAPRLDEIKQYAMDQLLIRFSEPLDTTETLVAGLYRGEVYHSGTVDYLSLTEAMIALEDSIPQSSSVTVFVAGWKDLLGNPEPDTSLFSVDTSYPLVVDVSPISREEVSVVFNQNMSTNATIGGNYTLSGQAIKEVYLVDRGYLVKLDTPLSQLAIYGLAMAGLSNSAGSLLSDTTISFQFDSRLESIVVADSQRIVLTFQEAIALSSSLQTSAKEQDIQYQGINRAEPSQYEVLFNENLPENEPIKIAWDSAYSTSGSIVPGFDTTFTYDTQPPVILEAKSDFFNKILVIFSEPVIAEISEEVFNFSVAGDNPVLVTEDSDSSYLLSFDTLLIGSSYQLVASNLTDLSGNRTIRDTIDFVYQPPAVPGFKDLRITEIMSDPSPSVGLPEVEYIEIWNASTAAISLVGVYLEDESGGEQFPEVTIDAGEYLAFAESAQAGFIYFEDFPSLTNSGESVALRSLYGDLIDSVSYRSQWISTSEKREGGYSLELVNIESNCEGPANWEASIDESGGTPGRPNSIASLSPDTIPPLVQTIELIDSVTLVVTFNEYMDTTVIMGGVERSYFSNLQEVTLLLDSALSEGAIEAIELIQFVDCSGNILADTAVSIPVPRPAKFGDLMITEIMPDPTPQVGLSDAEYVELLNLTQDVIDLDGLSINGVELNGELFPSAYMTLIPSALADDEKYVNKQVLSPWIGLGNTRDTLIISSPTEILVELVYNDEWYRSEEKAAGGYSLEIIDPTLVCSTAENWQASESAIGGTPGFKNSVFLLSGDQSGPVLLSAKLSTSDITLYFDEPLGEGIFLWTFDPELQVTFDSSTLNFPSQLVFSFVEEPVKNVTYNFQLTQVADCYGNITEGVGDRFLRPETSIEDIYINEVLFDPLTGGDDFVEIFNASENQYLDIGAMYWRVDDELRRVSSEFIMPPQSYVALTENKSQLLFDYPLTPSEKVLEVSDIPTLSNDEGWLVLVDEEGVVRDSIYYLDDYHSPLLADVEGVSLERLSIAYPAIGTDNWASASSVEGFATPGRPNSQSLGDTDNVEQLAVSPRTFIPGSSNATFSSFATISIKNEATDRLANVWIVNGLGQIIRTVAQGILLGADDFVTWDGTNDAGSLVPMGQYLVVVEFYGGNANAQVLKKPVTVGADY